jgi:DNA helicase-2/ATP-dependent DNA helicase PcrA
VGKIDPKTAKKMVAKFVSRCCECRGQIQAGDEFYWDGSVRLSAHASCLDNEVSEQDLMEELGRALRSGVPTLLWAKACAMREQDPTLFSLPSQKTLPLPDGIVGSPEQDDIWDALANSRDHIVVKALAGTGKSFTCRVGMNVLPADCRILYLAFNKEIVREFEKGAPKNAQVKTLNAIGFRVVKNAFPNVQIDDSKVRNILTELLPADMPFDEHRALVAVVEKLVALAQGYLLDGNDIDALLEVANRHEIEMESVGERALALVPQVLQISKERTGVISYNDQLWLPVVLNLACPKFDVIFVDEAQDLNRVQHLLVLRLLAPGGRVVLVGDDNQAIYGFRGSDVDSIRNFCRLLEKTKKPVRQLPLTVTRRCPKKVVAQAQTYVPSLQALPNAKDGEVIPVCERAAENLYGLGDLVVCRCNAPLLSVAFRLIQKGVRAVVRGRDIGQGLISLVQKLRASDINDLLLKLDEWVGKECAKVAGTTREESATQTILDRAECIRVLAEDADSVTDLCARITNLFEGDSSDPSRCVVLSSIHRAKGLEAERVFWLNPGIEIKSSQEWQLRQEMHLKYVAVTRAKGTLYLVG